MKKIWYKKILLLVIASCLLMMSGCGLFDPGEENVDWGYLKLGHMLPVPTEKTGNVVHNTSECLEVRMSDLMRHEFDEYTEKCEEKGFVIDIERTDGRYEKFVAHNSSGYKLQVYYWGGDVSWYPRYIIRLDAPMKMTSISWPTHGVGCLLPVPKSLYGKIERNRSDEFIVYVGNISKQECETYMRQCSACGFNKKQYSSSDFCAEDADGNILEVNYEGYNIMYVKIKMPSDD